MSPPDPPAAIDLAVKFASFSETWRPKIAAQLNGQDVRLVKTRGVFPWHSHADAEEMFLVYKGAFRVEFRDHAVTLGPGQMLVVPRGVEHRTASDEEAEVLIFEPSEVVNTGDAEASAFTAPAGVPRLTMPGLDDDLRAAADEELTRALDLGWMELSRHTPWGDTFEGFTPEGRDVCFERTYLWEGEAGGDIRVEVAVYEERAFEDGVRLTRTIYKNGDPQRDPQE